MNEFKIELMGKKLELMQVNFWKLPNFNFLTYHAI